MNALFSRKIICLLFGHDLKTTRNLTTFFKEYECKNCHVQLTNDDKGTKTQLTPELKEINEVMLKFYKKKHHIV